MNPDSLKKEIIIYKEKNFMLIRLQNKRKWKLNKKEIFVEK